MLTFNVTFDINIGMERMEEALMFPFFRPLIGLITHREDGIEPREPDEPANS